MSLAIHPLAALIPEMTSDQFAELRADIEQHGLIEAITLHEGMVLDGRHRLRACEETDVEARFEDFNGPSPVEFVISMNVKRRHLTVSQRAAIAVEFLPALEEEARGRQREGQDRGRAIQHGLVPGQPTRNDNGHRARDDAGALVGVSGASVGRARRVKEHDPEAFEQIKAGSLSAHTAATTLRERPIEPRRVATADTSTKRGAQIANAHRDRVISLASSLAGYASGIDALDVNAVRAVMEPADLEEWTRSLGDSLRKLSRFRNDLQRGRP